MQNEKTLHIKVDEKLLTRFIAYLGYERQRLDKSGQKFLGRAFYLRNAIDIFLTRRGF